MKQLLDLLDAESLQIFSEHNITQNALMLLTDDELVDIGITKKVPRLLILNTIKRLKMSSMKMEEESSSEDSESDTERNNSSLLALDLHSILDSDPKFRKVLYNSLCEGKVPNKSELLLMVRIICHHQFHSRIVVKQDYPKPDEKKNLAVQLINAFPQLGKLHKEQSAPVEAYFFWLHNGQSIGRHSGLIEQRISNMRKAIPKHLRKFHRKPKPTQLVVTSDDIATVETCAALEPSPHNCRQISEAMKSCSVAFGQMLLEKKPLSYILKTFPHFKAYNGLMIQQAFGRKYPSYYEADRKPFFSRALLLKRNQFMDVENEYIRSCLILMREMQIRGCKRPAEDKKMSNSEIFASPLVRWVHPSQLMEHLGRTIVDPHILCVAKPMKEGSFIVLLGSEHVDCGKDALQAVDILLKSFDVFNLKVPPFLRSLKDFVYVAFYKVLSHSSRSTVNELVAVFNAVEKAS